MTEKKERQISTHPVRETWFRGFVTGTMFLPQTTYGFTMVTLEAVLRDSPGNWIEFGKSRLTPDQKKRLRTIVSRAHMKHSVNKVSKNFMTDKTDLLLDSELQALWQYQVLPNVTESLLSIAYGRAIDMRGYAWDARALKRIGEVQDYFEDPASLSRAQKITRVARETLLHDPEIGRLSRSHKEAIRNFYQNGGNRRSYYDLINIYYKTVGEVTHIHRKKMGETFSKADIAWMQ